MFVVFDIATWVGRTTHQILRLRCWCLNILSNPGKKFGCDFSLWNRRSSVQIDSGDNSSVVTFTLLRHETCECFVSALSDLNLSGGCCLRPASHLAPRDLCLRKWPIIFVQRNPGCFHSGDFLFFLNLLFFVRELT